MKLYKVKSEYDAVIVSESGQTFLNTNQTLEFDSVETISVYPVGVNNAISFTLNLGSIQASPFYKSISHGENEYIIFLSQPNVKSFVISSQNIGGKTCEIEIAAKEITFFFKPYRKVVSLKESFDKFQTGKGGRCCYCLLTNLKTQQLLCYDTKENKLTSIEGEEISLQGESVTVIKRTNNVASSNLKEVYFFTARGLEKQESVVTYTFGKSNLTRTSNLVGFAFLDAVKNQDFETAKNYLSLSLRRKADSQDISAFLGKLKSFHELEDNIFALHNENGLQKATLSVEDGQIVDIDVV